MLSIQRMTSWSTNTGCKIQRPPKANCYWRIGLSDRDSGGRFLAGHRSTGGRPKGQRNKLAEEFYKDIYELWLGNGREALAHLASEDPVFFVRLVGASIPNAVAASLLMDSDSDRKPDPLDWTIKLVSPS